MWTIMADLGIVFTIHPKWNWSTCHQPKPPEAISTDLKKALRKNKKIPRKMSKRWFLEKNRTCFFGLRLKKNMCILWVYSIFQLFFGLSIDVTVCYFEGWWNVCLLIHMPNVQRTQCMIVHPEHFLNKTKTQRHYTTQNIMKLYSMCLANMKSHIIHNEISKPIWFQPSSQILTI